MLSQDIWFSEWMQLKRPEWRNVLWPVVGARSVCHSIELCFFVGRSSDTVNCYLTVTLISKIFRSVKRQRKICGHLRRNNCLFYQWRGSDANANSENLVKNFMKIQLKLKRRELVDALFSARTWQMAKRPSSFSRVTWALVLGSSRNRIMKSAEWEVK